MAFTESDLDRINTAIASGIRSVTFADGRRREYQNLDQLIAARDAIRADLAGQSSGHGRRRLIIGRVRRCR